MKKYLTKAFLLICLFFTGASNGIAAHYQDWWWNPNQSGMGFNIGQQDNTLVVSWYLYNDNGQARFLLLSGDLKGNRLDGQLIHSTGPSPSPTYNPNEVNRTPVGTASLIFKSEHEATFSYNYEGKKGTIALQRFTYAAPAIQGTWTGFIFANATNCRDRDNNGISAEPVFSSISKDADNTYTIDVDECVFTMPLTQSGNILTGSGSVRCLGDSFSEHYSWRGTAQLNRLSFEGTQLIVAEYAYKVNRGEICTVKGHFLLFR